MKQIIVNVKGLTIEEKRRVGVALATIKSIKVSNPMYWDTFDSMYGPSCDGVSVGYGYHKSESPTHTPQQVLEMARMAEQGHVPKTRTVNGVEVPDFRVDPRYGQEYWYPDASTDDLVSRTACGNKSSLDSYMLANNLCYEPTEEGKQAAILHSKAMLGIA